MLLVFLSFLFVFIAELSVTILPEGVLASAALPVLAFFMMRHLSGRSNVSVLAGVYGGVSATLLSFVPSGFPTHTAVLFIGAAWYAFMRSVADRRPRGAVLISFIEVFIFYFSVLAWHAFSHISLFFALIIIALGTALIFFNSITMMHELGMRLRLRLFAFSLVVGMILAELFFVFGKLPLHIVNIDFLLFFVYYVLWDMTARYLSTRFTKRALMINIFLLLVGCSAALAFVRWLPLR